MAEKLLLPSSDYYRFSEGKASPLGSTLTDKGVNFSIYSKSAVGVELWLFDSAESKSPMQIIRFDPEKNKSHHYWHVFVEGAKEGLHYGYKVFGSYIADYGVMFDGSKLLSDPFSNAVSMENYSRHQASLFGHDNTATAIKSVVVGKSDYHWQGDKPPNHKLKNSVIYELHVGGFTKNPNSGVPEKYRGTFKGLTYKIPYLKELGITAVELMPIFAFDYQDAALGLKNYWGYSPINFFSLHPSYGSTKDPLKTIEEFKDMVKEFHKASIEVILDVVYNHTAEAGRNGVWHNFKGLEAPTYYLLDKNRDFANYSGCGNTISANNPIVTHLIRKSLRYWVREMHVDGFRFDLASVLSRQTDGDVCMSSPSIDSIELDPELANTKLIAEAWDASGLYQLGFFVGRDGDARWAEWNGAYRDSIRQFVKSNGGMVPTIAARFLGSPDIYKQTHNSTANSINFICCHDGFTLNDIVSYNEKHNEINGENNRDGLNDNDSWNCGVEGDTKDEKVNSLRKQQIRNFISILFLTQGTPMLSMGDEIRRTQKGNNNAYCQDNEISWMDWNLKDENQDIFNFVKTIIKEIKKLNIFNLNTLLYVGEHKTLPHLLWHGAKLNQTDWSFHSRTLAVELVYPDKREHLYIIFNMYWDDMEYELPNIKNGAWRLLLDTSKPTENNFLMERIDSDKFVAKARSVIVLIDKDS